MTDLSIITPSRNEPYLDRTINDLLANSTADSEIIAILDGYWPNDIVNDSRVKYIHFGKPVGMRRGITAGADVSTAKYLMKIDAHCSAMKGFDKILIDTYLDRTLFVPVRYELDAEKWEPKKDKKHEFEYIQKGTLKGRKWPEYADRVDGQKLPDLMTTQGSCWFMSRSFYDEIGGINDTDYGSMGREAQEMTLKAWLSGGSVKLNRNVWYAHWNKPKEHVVGGMRDEKRKSLDRLLSEFTEARIEPIIEKFKPVPGWHDDQISS